MLWGNIAHGLCPKCSSNLADNSYGKKCANAQCNFFITKAKLQSLNDDFDRQDRAREMEGYGFE